MKNKSTRGGVKVLLNGNQAVQKVAKGKVGGISKAPKKAEPNR